MAKVLSALLISSATLLFTYATPSYSQPRDGELRIEDGGAIVFSAELGEWQAAETWWLAYARGSEGKFWGKGRDYPPYAQVAEHDTLLIEVSEGPCLMYFFHGRWRRAQDVQRWDPAFNEILGCPHVFD